MTVLKYRKNARNGLWAEITRRSNSRPKLYLKQIEGGKGHLIIGINRWLIIWLPLLDRRHKRLDKRFIRKDENRQCGAKLCVNFECWGLDVIWRKAGKWQIPGSINKLLNAVVKGWTLNLNGGWTFRQIEPYINASFCIYFWFWYFAFLLRATATDASAILE